MIQGNFFTDLESVLTEARKLQVLRIENAFKAGFRLPKEICSEYYGRYLLECKTCNDEAERLGIYKSLFSQFWTAVEGATSVPDELNYLDRITLFGEVCLGEHLGLIAFRKQPSRSYVN